MKKILLSVLFFLLIGGICVYAEDSYMYMESNELFNNTVDQIQEGNFTISPREIINYILDTLLFEIKNIWSFILGIFVIALFSGIINTMGDNKKEANYAAFFCCFSLMTIAVLKIINISVGYGVDVVNAMSDFVTKLTPMLFVLLAASGYAVTSGAFYPVFSASVWIMGVIIEKCIIPMIFAGCVMGIVNNITSTKRLENLTKLIKSATKWILTGAFTVFSGVNAIYGFSVPALDGIGIKTAKFALGSIVPVVGSFLAESVETVIATSHLIKNAVGTAGIVFIVTLCAIPAIKVCAIMITLKICASLIEPVADVRFSLMLGEASDATVGVLAVILTVSLLFIISSAIIIASTNVLM